MIKSRDVKFLEQDFEHSKWQTEKGEDHRELFDFEKVIGNSEAVEIENEDNAEENDVVQQQDVRRSTRIRNVPDRPGTITGDWWDSEELEFANLVNAVREEPTTFNEAINGDNSPQWKDAVKSEYESLMKNGTWQLVDLPPGRNLVGSKWIFKIKRNADDTINRYKARLVAQGFSQKEGSDYNEVFAPVAKYSSIRVLLALVNSLNLDLHEMDVKTAFLNGKPTSSPGRIGLYVKLRCPYSTLVSAVSIRNLIGCSNNRNFK